MHQIRKLVYNESELLCIQKEYGTIVPKNILEEGWEIERMALQSIIITEADFSENLKEIIDAKRFQISEILERLNEEIRKLEECEKICELLNEIKEQETELFRHLVSVSVLAQQIGMWVKWDDRILEYTALAGLLHDIGLYQTIGKKKRKIPFKDELYGNGYEKHITEGNHLLKSLKIDAEIIKGVVGHHERIDGQGFPLRLSGGFINQIARAVAVADAYDIYTMKYKGECGWSILTALQKMKDESSRKLDSSLVQIFVDHVAESAVNKNAVLSDGSTGKIALINKYDLLYPVMDIRGRSVDLSITKRVCVEEIL